MNETDPEIEELLKSQSLLHDKMMKEDTDRNTTVSDEDFEDVLKKFKKKNKRSYFFLTKAGERFQGSVYR